MATSVSYSIHGHSTTSTATKQRYAQASARMNLVETTRGSGGSVFPSGISPTPVLFAPSDDDVDVEDINITAASQAEDAAVTQIKTGANEVNYSNTMRQKHQKQVDEQQKNAVAAQKDATDAAGSAKISMWIQSTFGVSAGVAGVIATIAMKGKGAGLVKCTSGIGLALAVWDLAASIVKEAGVKGSDGKPLDISMGGLIAMGIDAMNNAGVLGNVSAKELETWKMAITIAVTLTIGIAMMGMGNRGMSQMREAGQAVAGLNAVKMGTTAQRAAEGVTVVATVGDATATVTKSAYHIKEAEFTQDTDRAVSAKKFFTVKLKDLLQRLGMSQDMIKEAMEKYDELITSMAQSMNASDANRVQSARYIGERP